MGEAKRRREVIGEVTTELTRKLSDEGKLIEAGAALYEHYVLPADASDVQRQKTRIAFMAGAQHLFASLMSIMDEGQEPTEADLNRMDLIHKELEQWGKTLSERMTPAPAKPTE